MITVVGKRLKKIRINKGYTLQALAEKTGINEATLSRIETGIIKLRQLDKLSKIAGALDIPLDNLMGKGDDNEEELD